MTEFDSFEDRGATELSPLGDVGELAAVLRLKPGSFSPSSRIRQIKRWFYALILHSFLSVWVDFPGRRKYLCGLEEVFEEVGLRAASMWTQEFGLIQLLSWPPPSLLSDLRQQKTPVPKNVNSYW